MLDDHAFERSTFRGAFLEVDYASFLTWRDGGRPEAGVKDCFAQAALRAADGAFLLGVMAPHTAHPGHIYFPGGTPDRNDIKGKTVDLEGSLWRELCEETGLTNADVVAEHGWHALLAGQRLALLKVLQSRETAESLRSIILNFLSQQREPELSDIRIVRQPADFDSMMEDFIIAFLRNSLS